MAINSIDVRSEKLPNQQDFVVSDVSSFGDILAVASNTAMHRVMSD